MANVIVKREYVSVKDENDQPLTQQFLRNEEIFSVFIRVFKQKLENFETELTALKAKVGA